MTDGTDAGAPEVWNLEMKTPMGVQKMTAKIVRSGDAFTGSVTGDQGEQPIKGKISGSTLTWDLAVTKPMAITLNFEGNVEGDTMTGKVKLGMFGNAPLTGKRA